MAHTTLMIAANWYGPFSSLSHAAKEADSAAVGEALYLAYNTSGQAYVGITGTIGSRFVRHHTLHRIMKSAGEIWIGLIASQSIPGRKPNESYALHSAPLRLAEQILIYALQPSENAQHRSSRPHAPGILVNRWFEPHDPWARREKRSHKEWPDFIEYEDELDLIQKAWLGGRHEILDHKQIRALSE